MTDSPVETHVVVDDGRGRSARSTSRSGGSACQASVPAQPLRRRRDGPRDRRAGRARRDPPGRRRAAAAEQPGGLDRHHPRRARGARCVARHQRSRRRRLAADLRRARSAATPTRASRPSGSSPRRPPWRGSTRTSSTAGWSPPRTRPPSRAPAPAGRARPAPADDRRRAQPPTSPAPPSTWRQSCGGADRAPHAHPLAGMPEVRRGRRPRLPHRGRRGRRGRAAGRRRCARGLEQGRLQGPRPLGGAGRRPGRRHRGPDPSGGGRAARRRPGHPHRARPRPAR